MRIILTGHGKHKAAAVAAPEYHANAIRQVPHGHMEWTSRKRIIKGVKMAAGDELFICSVCEMHLADCMCDWHRPQPQSAEVKDE